MICKSITGLFSSSTKHPSKDTSPNAAISQMNTEETVFHGPSFHSYFFSGEKIQNSVRGFVLTSPFSLLLLFCRACVVRQVIKKKN